MYDWCVTVQCKALFMAANLHPLPLLGMKVEVVGRKVTFSHSTELFQCQTSLLHPSLYIWWRNTFYVFCSPLIECIICILTHSAQLTYPADVHICETLHVYTAPVYLAVKYNLYFFVLSLKFFFPQLI